MRGVIYGSSGEDLLTIFAFIGENGHRDLSSFSFDLNTIALEFFSSTPNPKHLTKRYGKC